MSEKLNEKRYFYLIIPLIVVKCNNTNIQRYFCQSKSSDYLCIHIIKYPIYDDSAFLQVFAFVHSSALQRIKIKVIIYFYSIFISEKSGK